MNRTTANYDEPWKEALTEYFEAFFWTLRQKNGQFKSELHHYLIYLYRIPHSGSDSQDIFEDDC
ncbi:hypothetical protein IQ242_12720 [Microcystis sp. LEGE 08355]|nr:hypothetical protein [Microcystis sp. LEGE 08355]